MLADDPSGPSRFSVLQSDAPSKDSGVQASHRTPWPSHLTHHERLQRDQLGPPVDEIGLSMAFQLA